MDYQTEVTKIKDLLAKAKDILIVTHETPTEDSVGSALVLYLGLASLGKRVTIACPDPMTVGLSSYIGVNKIVSDLVVKKNFVISLDYIDGSIEKVSYNIEGDKFNLVIEPRAGFDTFSADKVHYAYAGGTADIVFAIDTPNLADLKKLYEGNKDLFSGKPLVNVDRHPNNAQYGSINLVDVTSTTTAEVVARLLSILGVKLTVDIATNLLNAVYGGTDNFTAANVSAGAFDVASVALKAGGKRFGVVEETVAPPQVGETIVPQTPVPAVHDHPSSVAPAGQAPSDWLRPKIFKSSNLL